MKLLGYTQQELSTTGRTQLTMEKAIELMGETNQALLATGSTNIYSNVNEWLFVHQDKYFLVEKPDVCEEKIIINLVSDSAELTTTVFLEMRGLKIQLPAFTGMTIARKCMAVAAVASHYPQKDQTEFMDNINFVHTCYWEGDAINLLLLMADKIKGLISKNTCKD